MDFLLYFIYSFKCMEMSVIDYVPCACCISFFSYLVSDSIILVTLPWICSILKSAQMCCPRRATTLWEYSPPALFRHATPWCSGRWNGTAGLGVPLLLFQVLAIISSFVIAQIWSSSSPSSFPNHLWKCWTRLGWGWADRDLRICWHLFINLPHWGSLFKQLCVNHPTTLCHPAHIPPSVSGTICSSSSACIIYFCSVTAAHVTCLTVSGAWQAGTRPAFLLLADVLNTCEALSELLDDWLFQPFHSVKMPVFLIMPVLNP